MLTGESWAVGVTESDPMAVASAFMPIATGAKSGRKIEKILTGKGGAVGRSAAGLLSLRRKVTEMKEALLCMQKVSLPGGAQLIAPSILATMNDKIAIVEAFLK